QPLAPPPASPPPAAKPEWKKQLRELWYAGHLIKRYRVPADAQECILNAFQEDGWPDCIDDPLPPKPGVDPPRRLQAIIKKLNGKQTRRGIMFHGNGNGMSICWEPRPAD